MCRSPPIVEVVLGHHIRVVRVVGGERDGVYHPAGWSDLGADDPEPLVAECVAVPVGEGLEAGDDLRELIADVCGLRHVGLEVIELKDRRTASCDVELEAMVTHGLEVVAPVVGEVGAR